MKSKLTSTLKDADACIAESGSKLKKKKVKKYAEGGKVGALSGLKTLAKKFENALEMEDHDQANRIARQMDSIEPGSSKNLKAKRAADLSAVSTEKTATFAEGGKVKAISKLWTDSERQGVGRRYWFDKPEHAKDFAARRKEAGFHLTEDPGNSVWVSNSKKKTDKVVEMQSGKDPE